MKFIKKQPFIDYCWRFGFDWSLHWNGLSKRRLQVSSHRTCYLSQPRHRLGSGQSHRQRNQQRTEWTDGSRSRYISERSKISKWTETREVLPTLPHLRQPVRPETEWRTAIRQTVPTKAPVEAETSTIINKRLVSFWIIHILFHINYITIISVTWTLYAVTSVTFMPH